jgi:hypothetical protein
VAAAHRTGRSGGIDVALDNMRVAAPVRAAIARALGRVRQRAVPGGAHLIELRGATGEHDLGPGPGADLGSPRDATRGRQS